MAVKTIKGILSHDMMPFFNNLSLIIYFVSQPSQGKHKLKLCP